MALRDLGYKAYEGERRAAAHNVWILLRHCFHRATTSWFVRLGALFCWVPPLIVAAVLGFRMWFTRTVNSEIPGRMDQVEVQPWIRGLFDAQFWLFVSFITIGAGASVIARDRRFKSFQYYFAKPVTPLQYLSGRVGAVAICVFAVTFIPVALIVAETVILAPAGMHYDHAYYILPTVLYALLIAAVTASISVGVSALSDSRALTMSAWAMLILIPHVLAWIVYRVADWPWLYLLSIPQLLGTIGDALFLDVEPEMALEWFHAAPVLAVLVGGALALSWDRIRRAEVIT